MSPSSVSPNNSGPDLGYPSNSGPDLGYPNNSGPDLGGPSHNHLGPDPDHPQVHDYENVDRNS